VSAREALTLGASNDQEDNYEEVWIVILNTKGRYELSKNQARLVQEAMANGERGAIVFETFAIPIPYVAEFYREKRFLKNTKRLPTRATEPLYKPIPKEKMDKIRKEIYQKIGR